MVMGNVGKRLPVGTIASPGMARGRRNDSGRPQASGTGGQEASDIVSKPCRSRAQSQRGSTSDGQEATMKSNPLTALGTGPHARSRDARSSGRARFATTRRMSLRLLAAFVALLFLAPLAIEQALAACPPSYRIKHSDSSCIHGWWDNSPSSSCWGTKGGAQSSCSSYGDITVNVDIKNADDIEVELTSSNKWRYRNCTVDTRQISCCMDESDLCMKSQVEEENGWIEHYDSSDNAFDFKRVSSHEYRYKYCAEHPTSVYCENDPKGDAFTAPLLCDGQTCALSDCRTNWRQSPADRKCNSEVIVFDDSDVFSPNCTIGAWCTDNNHAYNWASVTEVMWNVNEIRNCNGALKLTC